MCVLNQRPFIGLLSLLLLVTGALCSQEKALLLSNPSFEDFPHHSQPPSGWYFCGPVGESPPDVHPNGYFNVEHEAEHGDTYVGMVTRDNNSWECIGQLLETPLLPGTCYQFTIQLAQSQSYESVSRSTMDLAQFTNPIRLRLWGSNQNCTRTELLAQSGAVQHEKWTAHTFHFQPKQQLSHFLLEVYYYDTAHAPYNGNLLLDHAGPILPVNCDSKKPLIKTSEVTPPSRNAQDLPVTIAEQGPHIRFTKTGLQLEQHLFYDQAGALQQGNRYLWIIAQAMRQFPDQKLIIAVGGESEFEITERKFYLTFALREAGLPADRYKLKTLRRTDLKKEWLWKKENAEILMKVR